MRKYLLFFVFLFCIALLPADEAKTALVVGNSNYETSYLRNPINDAKAIAETLKEIGYDVILLLDVESDKELKKGCKRFWN